MRAPTGEIVGRELSAAGINMLLGPVVDVLDNPRSGGSGDIGIRSFGGNAAWVGQLGRAYVAGRARRERRPHVDGREALPGPRRKRPLDRRRGTRREQVARAAARDRSWRPSPPQSALTRGDEAATTDAMMVSHIRYRNFLSGAASVVHRADLARWLGVPRTDGPSGVRLVAKRPPRHERLARRAGGEEVVRGARAAWLPEPTPSCTTR